MLKYPKKCLEHLTVFHVYLMSGLQKMQIFFFFFSQSTHQVDMKNIVKCCKHFFGYFNTLETQGDIHQFLVQFSIEKQKFFKKYFGEVSSSRILVNKESKAIVHQANLFFSPLSVVSEFFM